MAITVQNRFKKTNIPVLFLPVKEKKIVQITNTTVPTQKLTLAEKKRKQKIILPQKKKQQLKPLSKKTQNRKKSVQPNRKTVANQPKTKPSTPEKKKLKKETNNKVFQKKKASSTTKKDINHLSMRAGYKEVEAHRRYLLFQEELEKHWKLPAGIPRDCICQIRVAVDWNGIITKFDVEKSSNILMYDVAARSALYGMKMPAWTKGKSLTITFKQ